MSSSDDDILGLLPSGRGRGRGGPAPTRLRNFKAMMSDSSDEDDKPAAKAPTKKPLPELSSSLPGAKTSTPTSAAPAPATVPAAATPPLAVPPVVSPPPKLQDESDESSGDESGNSIQFQEDDKSEVSMDLQSTMDDATPPKAAALVAPPTHVAAPVTDTQSASVAPAPAVLSAPQTTDIIADRVSLKPQQQPATEAKPQPYLQPPAPDRTAAQEPRDPSPPTAVPESRAQRTPAKSIYEPSPLLPPSSEEENDLLKEVLPLYPIATTRPPSRGSSIAAAPPLRTRSPSANTALLASAPPQPSSPRRDPLEDLLYRAQQRLKEKERLDQSLSSLPPQPSAAARAPSPLRFTRSASQGAFDSQGPAATPLFQLPLPESANSREVRLQKENHRLTEELAFLTKENQRLRTSESQGAAAEAAKLQVHVEVLKQQLREAELEAQRAKSYLESQLEDAQRHEQHMMEELKSYAATASQIDSMCREKDARIAELQQQVAKLQTSLSEKAQDARRIEEEAKRQRDDEKAKLDRMNALFDDVKKQRVQLQELNDKFQKDKEIAVADRRKMSEDLRGAQAELQRDRERHADETAILKRDVERYRQMLVDKERTWTAQLSEERRAKEHFQGRLAELEDSIQSETASLQQALRTAQEELRRASEDQGKKAQELSVQVQQLTAQVESAQSDFNIRMQREKAALVKEYSDKILQWKEQCSVIEDRRRSAEEQHDKLCAERDQYRREWEKCCEINTQWQRAKDKAEMQNVQLSAHLEQLIAQDEQLTQDNERYRQELDQAVADLAAMRQELEQAYLLEQQLQDLSAENDRISDECSRVTAERNELIHENARMAEEMVKWRNEMKDLFSSQKRLSAAATGASRPVGSTDRPATAALRAMRSADFTF